MKKKILFAAITIGAGITFAGCGQTSSTSTTEPFEKVTTTASESAASSDATSADTTGATTTAGSSSEVKEITVDEAKNIALKAAGLNEADVTFIKTERDFDDGVKKYEIEFINGAKEYNYEINMQTGEIIGQEVESIYD